MAPLEPTVATTRFGTVRPGVQLRSETAGRVATPVGKTVRKPDAVVLVTVTFRMTAVAVLGTPEAPPIWRVIELPGPKVELPRVSVIRCGICGTKSWPVAVASVK